MATKKEIAKEIILKANPNVEWTMTKLHAHVNYDQNISLDTVRSAVKELVEEGSVLKEGTKPNVFYKIKVSQNDPKEIEKHIVRTKWTRGWKTKAILAKLIEEKDVYRYELANMVGSDCHNVQMIIKTLKTTGTKYTGGPVPIDYDRKTRKFHFKGNPAVIDLQEEGE